MRNYSKAQKGQTLIELAIFGAIILFLFGTLLSYMQRFNDQQYVQMESFRRALEKANTYQGPTTEGAGASVQYSLMQNRRYTDLSDNFKKGNSDLVSGGANVFWAIPKLKEDDDDDTEAPNIIAFKINEDEQQWNYRDFIPKEYDSIDDEGEERQRYWSFEPQEIETDSQFAFSQEVTKEESPAAIINSSSSELQGTLDMTLPYIVKEVDKDDPDYENVIREGVLWEPTQRLYRDVDNQYKYSTQVPAGTVVEREKTWVTEFIK